MTRLKTAIDRDRIPVEPAARYADLAPWLVGSPYEVRAVLRRKIADEQLSLTQTLDREWGAENVSLLESALPRFGGEDVLAHPRHGRGARAQGADDRGGRRARTTSPRASSRSIARKPGSEFMRAAPLLPENAFAFAHLKVDVTRFLDAFFQRPELFTAADLGNLADALRSVPELGDMAGLKEKLARICDGRLSLGFFKEDRDGLDKPTPGYFVAWHLQDEKELKRILDAIGSGSGRGLPMVPARSAIWCASRSPRSTTTRSSCRRESSTTRA